MSLNRTQIATVIERTADAVVAHVHAKGPFRDVLDAADFVAEQMTVGKRPPFSANETAKDFAYIAGLMQSLSHRRCHLGPGARTGLVLVRSQQAQLQGLSEDEAVSGARGGFKVQGVARAPHGQSAQLSVRRE